VCAIISWGKSRYLRQCRQQYFALACGALADIHLRKKNAIVVGGSGLYLKGITHGFDQVPPPDPKLRDELSALPLKELAEQLRKLSPELAARTDLRNPRRLVRAIEIASASYGCPEGKHSSRGALSAGYGRRPRLPLAAFSFCATAPISTNELMIE
jgi:tRNA delta(2)-isopentenylpyrophosphate transferase